MGIYTLEKDHMEPNKSEGLEDHVPLSNGCSVRSMWIFEVFPFKTPVVLYNLYLQFTSNSQSNLSHLSDKNSLTATIANKSCFRLQIPFCCWSVSASSLSSGRCSSYELSTLGCSKTRGVVCKCISWYVYCKLYTLYIHSTMYPYNPCQAGYSYLHLSYCWWQIQQNETILGKSGYSFAQASILSMWILSLSIGLGSYCSDRRKYSSTSAGA